MSYQAKSYQAIARKLNPALNRICRHLARKEAFISAAACGAYGRFACDDIALAVRL